MSRLFSQHMEGILHSNSVHSQILFNTTYLNIYVEEKHDSSVIIQYVRRDHDEMQIRKNVTATSLFVTPSDLHWLYLAGFQILNHYKAEDLLDVDGTASFSISHGDFLLPPKYKEGDLAQLESAGVRGTRMRAGLWDTGAYWVA